MGIEVKSPAVSVPSTPANTTAAPAQTQATNTAAPVAPPVAEVPVQDKIDQGQTPAAQVAVEFVSDDKQLKKEMAEDLKAQMASHHAGGGVYNPQAKAKTPTAKTKAAVSDSKMAEQSSSAKNFNNATDVAQMHVLSGISRAESTAGQQVDQAGRTAKGLRNKTSRNVASMAAGAKQIYDGVKEGDVGTTVKGGIKLASGAAAQYSLSVDKAAAKSATSSAVATKAKVDVGMGAWKVGTGAIGAIKYGADAIKTAMDPNLNGAEKLAIGGAQAASSAFGATSVIEGGAKVLENAAIKATEKGLASAAKLTSTAEKVGEWATKTKGAGAILGKAFPVASTILAAKEATDVFQDPNSKALDKAAAVVHTATAAAAFVPVVGTAIAVTGELAYAGYKYARAAGLVSDKVIQGFDKVVESFDKTGDALVGVI